MACAYLTLRQFLAGSTYSDLTVMTNVLTFWTPAGDNRPMTNRSEQIQIRVTPRQKAALKRLAGRSGQSLSAYVLSRALPSRQAEFDRILQAAGKAKVRRWALAELNDFLTGLLPEEFEEAVAQADVTGLSPLWRNYVAAMIEEAARQKGVPPPAWAGKTPPLKRPYFAAPLKILRPHLLRASPVAFKRRNIFVDATIGDRV